MIETLVSEGVKNMWVALLQAARQRSGTADTAMAALTKEIAANEVVASHVRASLRRDLGSYRYVHALAEGGILTDHGFVSEFGRRVVWKVLPELLPENDVRQVVDGLLATEGRWLEGLTADGWRHLVDLVVVDEDCIGHLHEDVAAAIRGLAQRAGALGIDEELTDRLFEVDDYNSPFLDLSERANVFLEANRDTLGDDTTHAALLECITQCRGIITTFRDSKLKLGTSLRLTTITRRLLQQLERMELLIRVVRPADRDELVTSLALLIADLLRAHRRHRSLRVWYRKSTDLLTYQLTELSAKKGNQYISTDRKGYVAFFWASVWGGAVVAVFALLKLWLDALDLPLALEATAFSLNYALCFTLINLTGGVLATKQPAVTASAIAQRMDEATTGDAKLAGVVEMVMLVWRSQFISFVGNLICAFPMAWLISFGAKMLTGSSLASTAKAQYLLGNVHPLESAALYYAGIAGFFLFASGFAAVGLNNLVTHGQVAERMERAPLLVRMPSFARRLGTFVDTYFGAIVGNVILGFMLGGASLLGVLFGVPFDIRHIAFASAHFGVAVQSAPALISFDTAVWSAVGVAGIGFVNFVVSFGLTLLTTLRSREVTFPRFGLLAFMVFQDFRQRPASWFFPIAAPTTAQKASVEQV